MILSITLLGFIACRHVYWSFIKAPALLETIKSAESIILAIENYERKNGHPPKILDDLIPEFINSVPKPDGPAEGLWEYWTDDNEHYGKWHNQPKSASAGSWAIGIAVKKDFKVMSFKSFGDYFVYHPSKKHSDSGYGGKLVYEKDGWGYYSE